MPMALSIRLQQDHVVRSRERIKFSVRGFAPSIILKFFCFFLSCSVTIETRVAPSTQNRIKMSKCQIVLFVNNIWFQKHHWFCMHTSHQVTSENYAVLFWIQQLRQSSTRK